MTVKEAYINCKKILCDNNFEGYDFEALCLIKAVTGFDRLGIINHGSKELEQSQTEKLDLYIKQRLEHIPLQYIIGSWSFMGFDFEVGDGVLIPRDDTEVVVNLCLDFLSNRTDKKVIDLCAGSGAISVAVSNLANAEVTAVELSDKAFYFLEKNIKNTNVKAFNGDILICHKDFEDNRYDLIVSNPPYIKREDIKSLQSEVQYEPVMALDGGESGFDFYDSIIENWSSKLKKGGALAFELGEEQADYVSSLMKSKGFSDIRTELDFGGVQRAIIGTML